MFLEVRIWKAQKLKESEIILLFFVRIVGGKIWDIISRMSFIGSVGNVVKFFN